VKKSRLYAIICTLFLLMIYASENRSASGGKVLPAQQTNVLRDRLITVAQIPSVTGRESALIEYVKKEMPSGVSVRTDNMNNLIAQIGSGTPELLILCAIDEPGYVVSNITPEGFLTVQFPSGSAPNPLFHQFHEGHFVNIETDKGFVKGVVSIPSTHIFRGEKENLTIENFLIDIGARTREEALDLGVIILNPVSAVKDIALLQNNRAAGPLLSRKFPVIALIEAVKTAADNTKKPTAFAWTTQGYRSNSGAARLARQISPKQIIIVHTFNPQIDRRAGTSIQPVDSLGFGALITAPEQAQASSEMINKILTAAKQKGISIIPSITAQPQEISPFRRSGTVIISLGIPVKNPGTLVEVIDIDDLQELIKTIILCIEL